MSDPSRMRGRTPTSVGNGLSVMLRRLSIPAAPLQLLTNATCTGKHTLVAATNGLSFDIGIPSSLMDGIGLMDGETLFGYEWRRSRCRAGFILIQHTQVFYHGRHGVHAAVGVLPATAAMAPWPLSCTTLDAVAASFCMVVYCDCVISWLCSSRQQKAPTTALFSPRIGKPQ